MEKNGFSLMAFSTGRDNNAGAGIKRYYGIGIVNILGVNPDKDTFEKLRGFAPASDPVYIGEQDGVKFARIDFIAKTAPEDNKGIETTVAASIYIRNRFRFNGDHTKVQVIDKYGRTGWATEKECENHQIPQYANGPANIDADYRPCFDGEEILTDFLKIYLNIPSVEKWENKKVVGIIDNPQQAEARLNEVEKYFNGDFRELVEVLGYQPDNKVKMMFGIKTNEDGRQFQVAYANKILRPNAKNTTLIDDIQGRKANGFAPSTEYYYGDLTEYTVEPTNLEAPVEAPKEPAKSWFN
jgi:hypothetical protein